MYCSQAGRRLAAELLPQTLSLTPLPVLYPAVTALAVLSVISGGEWGERKGECEPTDADWRPVKVTLTVTERRH